MNEDTQTAGGTVEGFSLKPSTVCKYYLTADFRGTCMRNMRDILHVASIEAIHRDGQAPRIREDEQCVQAMVAILENSLINQFESDLSSAETQDENVYMKFSKNRLEANAMVGFHNRLDKLKLKAFSNMKKNKKVAISSKELLLKADRKLFNHLI